MDQMSIDVTAHLDADTEFAVRRTSSDLQTQWLHIGGRIALISGNEHLGRLRDTLDAHLNRERRASENTDEPPTEPATANYVQAILAKLNEELPGLDSELADFYALLVMTTGSRTTLQDVHSAWALWRNRTNPAHRSLVPFLELTREVQELDRKYRDAIVATAVHFGGGAWC